MGALGYGVIGLGRISSRHLDAIERLEGARVVAVADANAEKVRQTAERRGVRPYADYRALLADPEVDVAVVLVPTHLHAEVSVAAMDAGRHVMCEKAMAPSVADCQAMIAARERNQVKLMIAHSTRFQPQPLTARALIEDGAIGQVIGCDAHFTADATQANAVPRDFWRFKAGAAGHGYVVNFGCHYIDTARFMTGADPVAVFAHVGNRFSRGVIPEDHYAITALCDPDLTITIAQYGTLEHYGVRSAGYVIFGTAGALELTGHAPGVLVSAAGAEPHEVAPEPALLGESAWDREHRGFLRSIIDDAPEPVTGEDAMRNIEWASAAYLSSERGCRITLPLSEEDCAYCGPRLEETLPEGQGL
ncbi:MAG: Gfo/Idh/MocA family protein [Armatimonadota bacterium]